MGWSKLRGNFRCRSPCLTLARTETHFLGRCLRRTRCRPCACYCVLMAMGRERYVLHSQLTSWSRPAGSRLFDSSHARTQDQLHHRDILLCYFVLHQGILHPVFQTARQQRSGPSVHSVAGFGVVGDLLRCLCRRYGFSLFDQFRRRVPTDKLHLAEIRYNHDQCCHGQLCLGCHLRLGK